MAYFKRIPNQIRSNISLKKCINYITDPNKTDDQTLIYTHGVSVKNAYEQFLTVNEMNTNPQKKTIANHFVQSFLPGEITEEEAMEIAKELCQKHLKGRFQYLITTHNDKEHIHNHILVNHVSFEDYKCYEAWRDVTKMREVSDKICLAHGLEIIPEEKEKEHLSDHKKNSRSYFENMCLKEGVSWKAKIQYGIDLCIKEADSYEQFLDFMKALNFDYKDTGKYLSFKFKSQEKFTRCREKTLGEDYTREAIKRRIEEKIQKKEKVKKERKVTFIDKNFTREVKEKIEKDIQNSIKKSRNYDDFIQNMEGLHYTIDSENKIYKYNFKDKNIECSENKLQAKYSLYNIEKYFLEKEKNVFINFKTVNRTKYAIETSIQKSNTFDEFIQNMNKLGYTELEDLDKISFKYTSDKSYIPCDEKIFGSDYTIESIKHRINNKDSLLLYANIQAIKTKNVRSNQTIDYNINVMAENLIQLKKYGIGSFSEIVPSLAKLDVKKLQNEVEIEIIQEKIKNTSLSPEEKERLNLRISNLYNENRFINTKIKKLSLLNKNYKLYMKPERIEL